MAPVKSTKPPSPSLLVLNYDQSLAINALHQFHDLSLGIEKIHFDQLSEWRSLNEFPFIFLKKKGKPLKVSWTLKIQKDGLSVNDFWNYDEFL